MSKAYYIGLDLAAEVSVGSVVDEEGNELQHTRFVTEEKQLRGFLQGVPKPCYSVVEEGTQAEWVLGIAREICDKAIVCKPFKNNSLSGENKGDDADALNLAQKLRNKDVLEVWHDAGSRRRDLMQYALTYTTLVKECTREKNRIRAVFRSQGIRGAEKAYVSATREAKVAQLPLEGERHRVNLYGDVLDNVTKLRKRAWSAFYREVKQYMLFKRLLKTPAFGKVSAALTTAIIWDPTRFKDKRHFWSYCGFSLRTKDTGEFVVDKKTRAIVRKRAHFVLGLTREHNRTMKTLFKRAALANRRKRWKEEFQRLKSSGVSKDNATLTLARKVAAIALHLAKHGGEYNEDKVFLKR